MTGAKKSWSDAEKSQLLAFEIAPQRMEMIIVSDHIVAESLHRGLQGHDKQEQHARGRAGGLGLAR
jgi:hypothetical protein